MASELAAERARLALVVEASRLGTWELDVRTGESPRRSLRHDQIFGYAEPLEDWSFEIFLEHVHPDDRDAVAQAFQSAIDAGASWEFECRIHDAAGELRWIWARGMAHRDADGSLARLMGVVGDITERKETERALRSGEARLRQALDLAELGTWEWDLATGRGKLDERGAAILGLPAGVMDDVASAQRAAVHPDDLARIESEMEAGLVDADVLVMEYRVLRRGDRIGHVQSLGSVVRDADGSPVRLLGTIRDVTEERDAQYRSTFLLKLSDTLRPLSDPAEIQYEAARLLGLHLGASRVGYAVDLGDDETVEVTRNYTSGVPGIEGVYRYHDYGPGLVRELRAGRTVVRPDVARDPLLSDDEKAAHAALLLGATVNVPLLKDGQLRAILFAHARQPRSWTDAEVALLEEVAERTWAAVERALTEAELRAARDAAEEANRSKSEFLAVMSHELRTPLNAIAGYADLLDLGIHGPVTEQQRTAINRIRKSQVHLLGLINEVLNYARLESGAVIYDVDDIALREILASAEALMEPQAHARRIQLDVDECSPSLRVRADGEKLRQVLLNLLSNAVKFTDPGGRIHVNVEAGDDTVQLHVRDTGMGIPADRLETIFEPFVQVRSDLTRTAEGTGLGLAISRDLARGMGGSLTVASETGQGSVFTIGLPRASDR